MGGLDGLTFQEILAVLAPSDLWDIILYLFLVFIFITLFMQGDGSVMTTILLAFVVIGALIDKVDVFGNCGFEVMFIRVMFFVIPLIVAGVTDAPKSRPPAVIAAVLGMAYMFGTWFFVLQSPACPREASDLMLFPLSLYFLRQLQTRITVDSTQLFETDALKS